MPHIVSPRRIVARAAVPVAAGAAGLLLALALRPVTGFAQERRPAATRPAEDFQQEYRARFSALDARDVKGHYALAEWCREQGQYQLLLRQADFVLSLDPEHENAKLLRRIAVRELSRRPPAKGEPGRPGAEAAEAADGEYLTPSQIQKLRFAEFLRPTEAVFRLLDPQAGEDDEEEEEDEDDDAREDGPREFMQVRFSPGVLHDFLDEMAGHPDFSGREARIRFMKLTPTQQLQLIRHHTGDKYARRIEIASDPLVFKEFRKVQPVVMAGCATSACHGGPEAKGFRLRIGRPDTEANLYTNFMILNRVAKNKDRVINRTKPEDSLILEFGLPLRYAEKTHPVQIPELYPRGYDDPRYQLVLKWIEMLTIPMPRSGVSLPGYPEPPPPGAGIGGRPAAEEGKPEPGK